MEDDTGNIGTNTVSETFVADTTAPEIRSLGTKFVHNENSYVAAGETATLYLRVLEEGSGITTQRVAANLRSIGGDEFDSPDVCERASGTLAEFVCTWTVSVPPSDTTHTSEISVRYLEDGVGNNGALLAKNIVVDAYAPIVKDIEFHGFSAIGEKDYFQSNDDLIIDLTVTEGAGLIIYVDANHIVMDAQSLYAYGEEVDGEYESSSKDGWARFSSEDVCTRNEETFELECQLRVDSIRSGYVSSAEVEIEVQDTAGNIATIWPDDESGSEPANVQGSEGEYELEIFALDEETQPDFWEIVGTPSSVGDTFVDVDVAPLTYTRIYMGVPLNAPSDVHLARADLQSCSALDGGPEINRALLYGSPFSGPIASPDLNVVLEFAPFDGDSLVRADGDLENDDGSIDKEYTCTINLYSIVDDVAMNYAEVQEVTLLVPFGYSELGTVDENVDQMILDSVDNGWFKFLNVIGKINEVLKWINYAGRAFNILMSIVEVIDTIQVANDPARSVPAGYAYATLQCNTVQAPKAGIQTILKGLTVVFDVISCNPNNELPNGATAGMSWYYNYQKTVLSWWRYAKGEYVFALFGAGGPQTFSNPNAGTETVNQNTYGTGKFGQTTLLRSSNTGSSSAYDGYGGRYFQSETAGAVASSTGGGASLYDNIIVSSVGLCLPGVVHNLEKLRQIECTHIKCLQEGVATGLTTIDVCQKTKAYLTCKYWLGEVMGLLPLDIVKYVVDLVKNILLDPISILMVVISAACSPLCNSQGGGSLKKFCDFFAYFFRLIEVVGNVISLVTQFNGVKYDVCKEVGVKELLEQVKANRESAESEDGSVRAADLANEGTGTTGDLTSEGSSEEGVVG
jgi:hypothetical protein